MSITKTSSSARSLNDSLFDVTANGGDEMFRRRNESINSLSKLPGIETEEQIRRNESNKSLSKSTEDLGSVDMEEQIRLMRQIEERKAAEQQQQQQQEVEKEEGGEMVDVAPGIRLPLRSAEENWQAIQRGNVLVTQCFCCSQHLTLMDDARYLLCADCWAFSPIEHEKGKTTRGVCIGAKEEDIIEWLKQESSSGNGASGYS